MPHSPWERHPYFGSEPHDRAKLAEVNNSTSTNGRMVMRREASKTKNGLTATARHSDTDKRPRQAAELIWAVRWPTFRKCPLAQEDLDMV